MRETDGRTLFVRRSAVLLCAAIVTAAFGIEPVNRTRSGVAIEGTDPVAYFTQGKAVRGSADYEVDWNGATWRFASLDHRDRFEAEPEKFAPQYGGYCAYAVSEGKTAGIDPDAWNIVRGKLYLNNSPEIQAKWSENLSEHIARAEENWPRLLSAD